MCALPVVPQLVELVIIMFVKLFTIPSVMTRMRSIEREKGEGIGEGRIGGNCERNIMGRGRRERHLSDGVGMSFIKVLNHASCVCHVFFWFPCVFLLG